MRAGILIIGSLLWDNCQRDAWRRSRLCVDRAVHVKAPIYYGRRSNSRGQGVKSALGSLRLIREKVGSEEGSLYFHQPRTTQSGKLAFSVRSTPPTARSTNS